MIQMQTYLKVADNSGAYLVQCIKVCGSTRKRVASIGDIIMISVKKAIPQSSAKSKIKKGEMSKAIVVRVKKHTGRVGNDYIRFDDNAVVLINENGEPRGSRVFGPLARDELRNSECAKIISLAAEVL